jgi:hypothetical protein
MTKVMNMKTKKVFLLIILGVIFGCKPAISTTPSFTTITETVAPSNSTIQIDIFPSTTPVSKKTQTLTKTSETHQILKILFIGNSYTFSNNLPETFEKLMDAGGYEVIVEQSTNGGWSLSNHAESSQTIREINKTNWDYVILQEQSVVTNPDIGMYPAIRDLNDRINNTGAKTILFMTWGRKDGLSPAGYPDYASMQAQIMVNYQTIANELNLTIAPVGLIWQETLKENPNLQLWDTDGSHPSKIGTYLAANVFYTVLTGESPVGVKYLGGLLEENALSIQKIVSEIIFGNSTGPVQVDRELQEK